MFRSTLLLAALAAPCLLVPAQAEDMPMSHPGSMAAPAAPGTDATSTEAFKAANDKMHKNMMIPYSGDADQDFARGMSAHHQGAIDMAGVELKYGKDPQMRALAESIVKAQQAEITDMQAWLAKHGK